MNVNRHRFKFLTENDAITPDYEDLYAINQQLLYNRCANIFKYNNLPDTIPEEYLKRLLLIDGAAFIIKYNDDVLAIKGTLTDARDIYDRYLNVNVENAYAIPEINGCYNLYDPNNISKYNINKGVSDKTIYWIKNDTSTTGLLGIITKYAYLLTHAEISLSMATIQSRAMGITSGCGDQGQKELQVFYENLLQGKIYALKDFLKDDDTYKVMPYAETISRTIPNLIEVKQFLFNEFLNEIGIVTNITKKRAQQNNLEIEVNEDIANSLVDEMFETQSYYIDIINKELGTNIEIVKNYTSTDDNMTGDELTNEQLENDGILTDVDTETETETDTETDAETETEPEEVKDNE